MVRIRLRRTGLRHQPSYRIVVADIESPRDGRFLEIVGNYNPVTDPFTFDVMKLFKSAGVLDRYERFKKGESLEVLLAEAKTANEERNAAIRA